MEINAQRKECHILGLCFAGCVSILSREFGLFCTGGPVVFVVGTMRTLRHPRLRLRSLAPLSFVPTQGLRSFVFSFFPSYSHSFVRMLVFRARVNQQPPMHQLAVLSTRWAVFFHSTSNGVHQSPFLFVVDHYILFLWAIFFLDLTSHIATLLTFLFS
jgi:hypothetical protein